MAPIKFEEQLKDKLEKRSLSPSKDSWSKLSQRLDAEEKQNNKPVYWWLGVAAGLIVLLAVTIQFFNTEDNESVMPEVVEEKIEQKDDNSSKLPIITQDSNNVAVEDDVENKNTLSKNNSQIIDYKKEIQKQTSRNISVAEKENSTENKTNSIKEEHKNNKQQNQLTNEDLMKQAVASALENLKSDTPQEVTDREVDSLLKVASKELLKDKILKKTSKTVDANSLLMSVEEEMGQSFRSKVFEALKDSYETVKTAVAERNN